MVSRICFWLFELSHDLLSRCAGAYLGLDQPKTAALAFLVTVTQPCSSGLQKHTLICGTTTITQEGITLTKTFAWIWKRGEAGGGAGEEGEPAQIGLFVSSECVVV